MSDEIPAEKLDEVIAFIKKASGNKTVFSCVTNKFWKWTKNPSCKYVSITFDMRDGNFYLLDRNRDIISFEELKKQ